MQYYAGKIFEGKHRSRDKLEKGIYACLGTEGSSTARRSTGIAPQTPILPKRKQTQGTNKLRENNQCNADRKSVV